MIKKYKLYYQRPYCMSWIWFKCKSENMKVSSNWPYSKDKYSDKYINVLVLTQIMTFFIFTLIYFSHSLSVYEKIF